MCTDYVMALIEAHRATNQIVILTSNGLAYKEIMISTLYP